MRAIELTVRHWPWATAAAWGAGTLGLLGAAWLTTDDRPGGHLIAAAANGILVFSLVGGIGTADHLRGSESAGAEWATAHPWLMAAVPAAATFGGVLALRLAALAGGIDGPWSSPAESILDVAARAGVVLVIVGVFAARR